ncbi:Bacterial extracellular solute-binding protein [Streptomyces sp. ADI97-07]|uniref:ABC transporter substrate-binding protein n=1 Tax=Streptomyces sp. ADI97-07 TaxID=1522762 RepID=UPI000F5537E7|nr:ABC transporter substrate-binding protein [Streptomyces sp. ADI97-07]RPK85563.1 Bacterial extracellular solute-binding protein [Streptomyces sp. ADI97-07]
MNRRLIRRTAAMGLAGALALGLAACGGPTGGASTGDGRELTYWSMWKEGEPQQKALSAAIEDFTAETGIEVDVQWQGRDVLKKLQPTLHGVPAADLVDRSLPQVKSMMVSTGTAADLTGVLKEPIPGEPGRTVGDVVPAKYLELGRAEGKQVVLPYAIVANGLWYDGASFPGLREKPPKDWDAFRATLAAEKKAGRAPLALDADIPDYGAYWYSNFVVGAMGPGSLHEAAADRTGTVWKQPGYVRAAERVAALAEDGYFADGYDASKFPAIQQKWATGKAGFLLMGSWIAGETKPYAASGFDFRMLPFPTDGAPGAGTPVEAATFGWVVPAKARQSEAARRFIAFLYGKKQMQAYADQAQGIVAREDIETAPAMADVARALKESTPYPTFDGVDMDFAEWWTKTFHPLSTKLVTGKISAADFSEQLAAQSADFWKRAG